MPGDQRALAVRLRAVVEAKDIELAALRADLAERELIRRLELRIAELERRLGKDRSDSGTPTSGEADRGEGDAAGAAAVRAGAQEGPHAGPTAGACGQGSVQGSGSERDEGRGPACGVPPLQGRAGRRGCRRAAVGAGHRRGGGPGGDRLAAAGAGVPVLRELPDPVRAQIFPLN
jgi:hypothetical protein